VKHISITKGKSELISTGGNHLCGLIFRKELRSALPKNFTKKRADAISDRDVLSTQIGLLCNARNDFNDVDLYREDEVFLQSFGIDKLPSEAVFRQRFDEMPEEKTHAALRESTLGFLSKQAPGTLRVANMDLVPVDVDVSPFDNSGSHKQGVSHTYKGHAGYAPMFAYIGTEGYMLDCELRPGKQHCQSGTPKFLRRTTAALKGLGLEGKVLYRLDSGNDAKENFQELGGNFFIVKRNLRKEIPEQWLALARRVGEKEESREGKNVYRGVASHIHPGGDETIPAVPVVFEVTERLCDAEGNELLIPEIEVDTFWTNLPCGAGEVIELYHAHGTSEQFHSEVKTDMDVERLPSGKLCVNKIVLLCAMMSYNVLRRLGQAVIRRAKLAPVKIKVSRWRLKTVLQNLVYCAGKLVRHAGGMELQFGKICPWYAVIRDIAAAYA
jgi:hypothetical protein